MLGRQEKEFPQLNSGADLISSWQLAVTVAERACVPAGEGNKERGQRFPRENLGSCGATGGAPAGAEAFPKGFGLQPALGGAAGAAHLTLRCLFCGYGEGGSPEKAAGEGSSGGSEREAGLQPDLSLALCLSRQRRVCWMHLSLPGIRRRFCSQVSCGGSGAEGRVSVPSSAAE